MMILLDFDVFVFYEFLVAATKKRLPLLLQRNNQTVLKSCNWGLTIMFVEMED